MTPPKVIVISGADAGFYDYLKDTVDSLLRIRPEVATAFDIGILDCALQPAQCDELRSLGATVVAPAWPDFVPAEHRQPAHAPRFVRTRLPELFPGYDIYVWVDADAWVQDARFFDEYVQRAKDGALVIVHEDESAYAWDWKIFKWNLGNFVLSFGLWRGLYLWSRKRVNNGLFALRGDAPHWQAWEKRYAESVQASKKFYSQIPMTAAIYLDRLPIEYVSGHFNWITSRAAPHFDAEAGVFCTPYDDHAPLSVIHLAGPDKNVPRAIPTTRGGATDGTFRYRDWLTMRPQRADASEAA